MKLHISPFLLSFKVVFLCFWGKIFKNFEKLPIQTILAFGNLNREPGMLFVHFRVEFVE